MNFLKFTYRHSCDLGGIPYSSLPFFYLYIYLEGDVQQPFYEYFEEGNEDGNKIFYADFKRNFKKYKIKTEILPEHVIDALHRMKLHDNIELTLKNGETHIVKNVQVESTYPFGDSYCNAEIIFDLDEKVIATRCCGVASYPVEVITFEALWINPYCALTEEAEPVPVGALFSKTDETSCDEDDGTATIYSEYGGSGVYEYSKDNGANWQLSNIFTGLAPDSYLLKIRDKLATANVAAVGTAVIAESQTLAATIVFNSCWATTDDNGRIYLYPISGGSGEFEVSIDDINWYISSKIFTGLTPDDYTVYLRDKNKPACKIEVGTVTILATLRISQASNCAGGTIVWNRYNVSGSYYYTLQRKDGGSWVTILLDALNTYTYYDSAYENSNDSKEYRVSARALTTGTPIIYGEETYKYDCLI